MLYEEIVARIIAALDLRSEVRAVVAAPYSDEVMATLNQVYDQGYLNEVILVGDAAKIPRAHRKFRHIGAQAPEDIAMIAASEASAAGSIVVKGNIASGVLLRAVLKGGAQGGVANHVYIINSKGFPRKAILVSDAGVNIRPDLNTKVKIIGNAIAVAQAIGIDTPRVALLSAVETVNPAMPSTLDAAALKVMGERGVFGTALVDGPMALDAAMMPEAASTKGLGGPVAGDADILVLDDIEAGNSTAKALIGADGDAMGVIVGGRTVVAFPSRGDSAKTRFQSLMLATYLAGQFAAPPGER